MIPPDERTAGLLKSPLGLTLLDLLAIQPRPQDIREMSEAELYGSAVSTCIFMSPHRSDYDSRRAELLAMAPRFVELAERVVSLPATATWWDPMDADHQVWVSKTGERPRAKRMEIDFSQYPPEVTKPRKAIWTSSPVRGGLPAGWIEWLVSGEATYGFAKGGVFTRIDGRTNAPAVGTWKRAKGGGIVFSNLLFNFNAGVLPSPASRNGAIVGNFAAHVASDGTLVGTFTAHGVLGLTGFSRAGTFTGTRIEAVGP